MTDKQIIIGGIDVSGCCHQGKDNTCTCPHYKKECGKNPNCHYKIMQRQTKKLDKFYKSELELKQKLFRKEQECSFNTLKIIALQEALEQYETEHDQLKAENDGLKTMLKDLSYENQKFCYQIEEQTKQLEPFKDEYFKGLDNVVIAELAKKSIRITAENRKLEKTLTEIKELAEHCITQDICTFCDYSDKCYIEDEEIPTYDVCKLILQKISEVVDENI